MDKSVYKKPWFVYIAECGDKTLYVGVARDVEKRIHDHNSTGKCRYTRSRKPIGLLHKERKRDYNAARKREAEIRTFSRKKKLCLINS